MGETCRLLQCKIDKNGHGIKCEIAERYASINYSESCLMGYDEWVPRRKKGEQSLFFQKSKRKRIVLSKGVHRLWRVSHEFQELN